MFLRRSGKLAAPLALVVAALSGIALSSGADAQYVYRPPHVYNPNIYSNNRALMNNRAAARRTFCRHHPRAERCRARAVRKRVRAR